MACRSRRPWRLERRRERAGAASENSRKDDEAEGVSCECSPWQWSSYVHHSRFTVDSMQTKGLDRQWPWLLTDSDDEEAIVLLFSCSRPEDELMCDSASSDGAGARNFTVNEMLNHVSF
ncbi:unnamed protein product [Pleuronectes platessa]|uniref:Uncharacterized protein n=1 Tax=Pleuronectes platessa TaxID=8262 RepID=A0A9N7TPN5_PLEPL|nr:unnamed protein product [Pleuronectes platessa]